MKITVAWLIMGLVTAGRIGGLSAGEHPTKEHPQGQEHPATTSPTVTTPAPPPPAAKPQGAVDQPTGQGQSPSPSVISPTRLQEQFAKTVESHVRTESQKTRGAFVVRDEELDKDWKLSLVRIHTDKIVPLGGGRFFACADFMETRGKQKAQVDLDFYATQSDSGWHVEEVLVHKVNAKPRFTYDRYNNRVPVIN